MHRRSGTGGRGAVTIATPKWIFLRQRRGVARCRGAGFPLEKFLFSMNVREDKAQAKVTRKGTWAENKGLDWLTVNSISPSPGTRQSRVLRWMHHLNQASCCIRYQRGHLLPSCGAGSKLQNNSTQGPWGVKCEATIELIWIVAPFAHETMPLSL